MAELKRTEDRRWFGRGRTRALLAAGLLVGTGAVATSAYWTAKKTITGTTLTAGSMHIDLATNVRIRPESYAWTSFDLTGMTSGTTRAAAIKVANNSSGPLTFSYSIKGAATGTLGAALTAKVYRGGTATGNACGGTLIGSGSLNGLNLAAGANLAPAASTNICFEVTLPSAVAGGLTSTVTLTFPATQVP